MSVLDQGLCLYEIHSSKRSQNGLWFQVFFSDWSPQRKTFQCQKKEQTLPGLNTWKHRKLLHGLPNSLHMIHRASRVPPRVTTAQDGKRPTLPDVEQLDSALDALFHINSSPCSNHVYKSLLKTCNKRKSLPHAKQIHAHLALHRLDLTPLLGNYLAVTLATCGALEEAHNILDKLPRRTVHSWTAIISAYTECGRGWEALQMHQSMREDGVEPDHFTFASLFKACGGIPALQVGRELHADAERKGFALDVVVGNSLVSMYGKCGIVVDAEAVFGALSKRVVVSWNAMLGVYMDQGHEKKALQLYRQMCEEGVSPNQHTFATVLLAFDSALEKEEDFILEGSCAEVLPFKIGQALHADARTKGLATDAFVSTALLNMYGKCGTTEEAENTFTVLSQRDVVSWSAMLYAYVEQGQGDKALQLYREMQKEGVEPDQHTFVIALQACGILAEQKRGILVEDQSIKVMPLEIVEALHDDVQRKGFASDIFVGNILVNVYGKCASVTKAENVFVAMPERDVVSSTAMLLAFAEQGQGHKAFQFYRQMQQEGVKLNDVNLICMLQVCVETGSLEMCKDLHFSIVSAECDLNSRLGATLLNAYGTCASMADAQAVFDGLLEPDAVSWSVSIAGYAGEAHCTASLQMFEAMQLAGVCPDEATFASVIAACSHAGLVVHGLEYFESMSRDFGMATDLKHYGGMVDLLARAGAFKRIENLMERMPMPADLNVWLCLLSACRLHGNVELGKQAFEHAVRLQPKQTAAYSLMSNIRADAGWSGGNLCAEMHAGENWLDLD